MRKPYQEGYVGVVVVVSKYKYTRVSLIYVGKQRLCFYSQLRS